MHAVCVRLRRVGIHRCAPPAGRVGRRFSCALFWRKAGEAQREVERSTRESTLKGQRCSFGRQPSLAPLHEAYAHGVSNYSVSPQRKATSLAGGRRTQTRLLASAGVACAFFFAGMACRLVRPAMKGNTETHTDRGNEDGVTRFGLCPAA
jgi:hypothetical protein